MKTILILLLLISCCLSGCQSDFLDRVPLDQPSNASFFSTENELDLAINGAYRQLYWHSYKVPYPLWLDASTDLAWCRGDFGGMLTAQGGQFTAETPLFNSVWVHMYEGIARANNILENMHRAQEVVTPEKYAEIEAEARFLRAYFYFYLTNLYGDVPLVTTMLQLSDTDMPRINVSEVRQQIYADLEFAAQHLPQELPANRSGRASAAAALTLMARTALLAGDYQIAAEKAKAVIDMDQYQLYPDYRNLFQPEGTGSSEVIMEQQYHLDVFTTAIPRYLANRESGGYSVLVPTQILVDMYACKDGLPIDESPLYDPASPFENRDPRLDHSIVLPGEWINDLRFQTHPDSVQTYKRTANGLQRVGNPEVTNAYATFTGYLWNKYYDEDDMPGNANQSTFSTMLFRYAEVLLTYAEAKIELNQIDQSVVAALNEVRTRKSVEMPAVNIAMNQQALRKTVRYERTIEFALEGFRLFDIRRWGIAEKVMPGDVLGRRRKAHWYDPIIPAIDEDNHPVYNNGSTIFQIISTNQFTKRNYLWPIPQPELDLNKQLTQNEGY
ncbi:RagB/SusD family nutrient uptake outer membrane protein [Sphingobacterium sp. SGR-19]|uniref:RagB/SusD family nutrient uptake outer membrane protein n=1 Tax=Sphingobacterium sp. SGR-19 TaxID=2710886 RepID=UPI0013ECF5AF|nr:RagB/SusD family nutrient uptake outer membrane protein [Sphingobacterium sp. SGR-19]NGM64413.1 RagB/SusD family nutrient uptake outer membrane protein [Sphingobacterium sp. SGR-19]